MPACYRKAFTLIEFLIALVIIGFIVAILVGVFANPVKQARASAKAQEFLDSYRQIKDAWDLYEVRTGHEPLINGCTFGTDSLDILVRDGYLSAIPHVPMPGVGGHVGVSNYCSGAGVSGNMSGASGTIPDMDTFFVAGITGLPNDASNDDVCAQINALAGAKRQGVPTCSDNLTGDPAIAMDGPEAGSSQIQCCINSGGWRIVFGFIRPDTGVP